MLTKNTLPVHPAIKTPSTALFNLPEKVLQFGTGVLLRGLPDYYIEMANRKGVFNGCIVVVKSTSGSADDFEKQDALYTLHIRGISEGKHVEEHIICSSISRVLTAQSHWEEILEFSASKDLEVVISNTTEEGLQYLAESIHTISPVSFPGKLLAVLYHRFRILGGSADAGLVIIPTELVVDNGDLLKSIVVKLAEHNQLGQRFIDWLLQANHFCNSLVDRIVPGKPDAAYAHELNLRFNYTDNLQIIAEPYNLWAIQGGAEVVRILSFKEVNKGIVVTPDIEKYRELKLRLLNASHTLSCAVAVLSGFTTVNEAMSDAAFKSFITHLMLHEIAPAIPYPIEQSEKEEFVKNVIDRFSNPYIKHQWLSIAVQYSLKMRTRVLPLLLNTSQGAEIQAMAMGFAAFLRLMKTDKAGDVFTCRYLGDSYKLSDSNAHLFYSSWNNAEPQEIVDRVFSDAELLGSDISVLIYFKEQVVTMLERIESDGILNLLKQQYQENE